MKTVKTIAIVNGACVIYLPAGVRRALKLNGNDRITLEVVDGALIIKPYFDAVGWANEYLAQYNSGLSLPYKRGRDRMMGITTVILPDGEIGVAQCGPNDVFDNTVGEAIALARALGEDDEIPKEIFE